MTRGVITTTSCSRRGSIRLTTLSQTPQNTTMSWHLIIHTLIEQGFTSPPTQYRLSGRRFYRSKDPTNSIKVLKEKHYKGKPRKSKQHKTYKIHNKERHIENTANPLVYNNIMGWLGDGSHRGSPSLNGGGAAATVPPSHSWGRCSSRDGSHSQRGEIRRPRCSLHLWANCSTDLGRFCHKGTDKLVHLCTWLTTTQPCRALLTVQDCKIVWVLFQDYRVVTKILLKSWAVLPQYHHMTDRQTDIWTANAQQSAVSTKYYCRWHYKYH